MKSRIPPIVTRLCLALVLLLAANGTSSAFRLIEHSLDEKVAASTLVIVGRVSTQEQPITSEGRHLHGVAVTVEITLKGKAPATVPVVTRNGIGEMTVNCVLGVRYLFFLTKVNNGHYQVVDGHFGAYRLDDSVAKP